MKEVAIARGTGPRATSTAISVGRDLVTVFAATNAALAAGELSFAHAKTLSEGTDRVEDVAIKRRIEAEVLPKAATLTAWQFHKAVVAAVCTHDHANAVGRHVKARNIRSVVTKALDDGMGQAVITDTGVRVNEIQIRIDAAARELQLSRGGASAGVNDLNAYLGACRADVVAATFLGTESPATDSPTTVTEQPSNGSIKIGEPRTPSLTGHLVVDYTTLTGLNDRFCLLDGQPIPAAIGRELARGIKAWRRMVTDPVTGHLLDYGRLTYLPKPLLTYIGARDQICRAPFCNAPASRSQVDHAEPFPAGPSNTTNTGLLCSCNDHALKTDTGFWHIRGKESNGSATFVSPTGQEFRVPPRPYLHDPADADRRVTKKASLNPVEKQPPLDRNAIPPF